VKIDFYGLSLKELDTYADKSYRSKQIYNWAYAKYVQDFRSMSNISKGFQEELDSKIAFDKTKIVAVESSKDGSKKYLFCGEDGHTFEAVLIKMKEGEVDEESGETKGERYTLCVSSQVGCKIGCSFCLTAKGGFVRNLTVGEIVFQVLEIKRVNNLDPNKGVNIVFMGMGEPLDNFENVCKSIEIMSELNGLSISPRRITISTSGISPKIHKLGEENLGVNLAISLHAVDDKTRESLIPLNKAYNIESVIEAVKKFPIDRRKRVMFEYIVIKGVNDSLESAKKLVKLLNGIKAKVNLIYFNPYPESPYKRPSKESMVAFQELLIKKGVLCTIRESKGLDISAACGQLREQQKN